MWTEKSNKLYRKFKLKDFVEAMGFMVQVGICAEKQGHHPTIKNTYNTVEIWLTTHDEGNTITAKDKKLAKAIDALITS